MRLRGIRSIVTLSGRSYVGRYVVGRALCVPGRKASVRNAHKRFVRKKHGNHRGLPLRKQVTNGG